MIPENESVRLQPGKRDHIIVTACGSRNFLHDILSMQFIRARRIVAVMRHDARAGHAGSQDALHEVRLRKMRRDHARHRKVRGGVSGEPELPSGGGGGAGRSASMSGGLPGQ